MTLSEEVDIEVGEEVGGLETMMDGMKLDELKEKTA